MGTPASDQPRCTRLQQWGCLWLLLSVLEVRLRARPPLSLRYQGLAAARNQQDGDSSGRARAWTTRHAMDRILMSPASAIPLATDDEYASPPLAHC